MSAYVTGVAVWGPGLPGWAASQAVLAGVADRDPAEAQPPPPAILSATERRRTGPTIRLALTVCTQAMEMAGRPPGSLTAIFGSANGDGAVVHAILETLASPERQVSPTQFHNSVHNAAGGYWSIATASRKPATSLAAHDGTFAAALLSAMATVRADGEAVLLCVYDTPLPPPLAAKRPILGAFAAALVLSPEASGLARIGVTYAPEPADPAQTAPLSPALRPLAHGNPAARALRLLEHLARGEAGTLSAGLLDGRVDITVQPWPHPPTSPP